jgi:conjugative relaxase-like TrwC/TraI family protein
MLSIGAMGGGQGAYYLGLTEESYYQNDREPQGEWYGKGAEALDLVGTIQGDEFLKTFQGFSHITGEKLIQNAGREDRQPGWDLTFSAPKSVSILWAIGGTDTKKEIEQAHQESVKAALDYLQKEACFTRRGQGGRVIEEVSPVIAIFQHGTSRANDPQLHTHTLVLNVGVREDKTTGTLLSKPFFDGKMAGGALYRTHLASRLAEYGYKIEKDRDSFAIAGISQAAVEHFSKRRAEIEETLKEKGLEGAKASSIAALSTREAKNPIGYTELFPQWEREAKNFGLTAETIKKLKTTFSREESQLKIIDAMSEVRKEIDTRDSFTRNDLVESIARHGTGQGINAILATASPDFLEKQGKIIQTGTRGHTVFYKVEKAQTEKENLLEEAQPTFAHEIKEALRDQWEFSKKAGKHHIHQLYREAMGWHTWKFNEPKNGWKREALEAFTLGDTKRGLHLYDEKNRVIESQKEVYTKIEGQSIFTRPAMVSLIHAWKRHLQEPFKSSQESLKDHLIVTESRREAKELNRLAQAQRAKLGQLNIRRIKTKGQETIREKDRVLYGGQLGTVKRIELLSEKMVLDMDNGKTFTINYRKAKDIKLGYAVTWASAKRISRTHTYALAGFYNSVYIEGVKTEKNTYFFVDYKAQWKYGECKLSKEQKNPEDDKAIQEIKGMIESERQKHKLYENEMRK